MAHSSLIKFRVSDFELRVASVDSQPVTRNPQLVNSQVCRIGSSYHRRPSANNVYTGARGDRIRAYRVRIGTDRNSGGESILCHRFGLHFNKSLRVGLLTAGTQELFM